MVPIVTATDERYLPGVLALYNSYLKHSAEGFSFHCLAYGDESLKRKLEAQGIHTILNKYLPVDVLPMSPKYDWYRDKIESAAMYARLMIPDLFSGEKSVYIDADAVILKSLDGLVSVDMKEHPCAGTVANGSINTSDVPGCGINHPGICSSMIVFNHEWWREKNIYNKCLELMRASNFVFKTVVQGVLSYTLKNDFYKYTATHQVHGGHQQALYSIHLSYVLHFIGTNPWEEYPKHLLPVPEHKEKARSIWRQYA